MVTREIMLAALVERFGDRGVRVGTSPDSVAVFPAIHLEVGDSHLAASERSERVMKDVVRP